VRFLAILLVVALTGPSAGALVCEFACAAEHSRVPAAGSCHEHDGPASTTTMAAGHECHDVTSPEPSTMAVGAPQVDLRAVAEAGASLAMEDVAAHATVVSPPRASTHTSPPSPPVPLRI
jgi:hypothetical protein